MRLYLFPNAQLVSISCYDPRLRLARWRRDAHRSSTLRWEQQAMLTPWMRAGTDPARGARSVHWPTKGVAYDEYQQTTPGRSSPARSGGAAVPADAVGAASPAGRCRSRSTAARRSRGVCPPMRRTSSSCSSTMPGPALPSTFGGEVNTPTLDRIIKERHLLQPLPHHRHVLAHAGVAADRPQPSPRRQRPDRGAGERLGRLLGHHPEEQRHRRRGAEELRLRHRRPGASGTTRPPRRRPPPARSSTGRPATASSTSTASWPARRRSTSRTWCATRPSSRRPRRRRRAIT